METKQSTTVNRAAAAVRAAAQPAAAKAPAPKAAERRVGPVGAAFRAQTFGRVSAPGDPAEREAEATARAIVRMAAPGMGTATDGAGSIRRAVSLRSTSLPPIGRHAGAGLLLPREAEPHGVGADGKVPDGVGAEIGSAMAGGSPLPGAVRAFMEPRFGADFGNVRIHTDDRAAALSRQLSAHAFTVGGHVFFGKDRFRPDADEGRELIAHELTHTIQQGAARQLPRAGASPRNEAPRNETPQKEAPRNEAPRNEATQKEPSPSEAPREAAAPPASSPEVASSVEASPAAASSVAASRITAPAAVAPAVAAKGVKGSVALSPIVYRAAMQRSAEIAIAQKAPEGPQRWGFGSVLKYFGEAAYNIPGYRLFTIVVGVNPIGMTRVERTAANILRALIEVIPGGALIAKALDTYGVFDKAGAWVEAQFRTLGMTAAAIGKALDAFLDSLGPSDIFRLGSLWDRAKRIFAEPAARIWNFATGLAAGIIKLIKDAILRPLAALAQRTNGYDLLKAVLKKDPITGEAYPRNAETMIAGFMKLIGREDVWENIKKGNAIARAWAWFQNALNGLMGFVTRIPGLIVDALRSLTLTDIIVLPVAFGKIVRVFGNFAMEFVAWGGRQVLGLLEIIFSVVAPGAVPYINKVAATFHSIVQDPVGFVGNMVKAGVQGFRQFSGNFRAHLQGALIDWLTGTLAGANIHVPRSFDFRELLKFSLSVLGITWANIRARLVKAVGETAVGAMETGVEVVRTLVSEGPAAAWEKIQEHLVNLKGLVMDQIAAFVARDVVQKGVTMLLTSLNPVTGFINGVIATFRTIMFFVERLKQILQVAKSFLDSISSIAAGAIAAAADRAEKTMEGLLGLMISFMARVVGLGSMSDAVLGIVTKIRTPIDKALDKVVEWIVATAKKGGASLLQAGAAVLTAVTNWFQLRRTFKTADGESHALYFEAEGKAMRLMVASDPTELHSFLKSKRAAAMKDKGKKDAIKAIDELLVKIEAKMNEPVKEGEKQQVTAARESAITALFNEIGTHVVTLLTEGDWGTTNNPLPIDYPKRRASAYRVLYFGPRTKDLVSQDEWKMGYEGNTAALRSIASVTRDQGAAGKLLGGEKLIGMYPPMKRQALPEGGETIGISPAYDIAVGKILTYEKGHTGGGKLINEALQPYGYKAGAEGMDGDHVVEMQLGGDNVLENLWPLDKSENRASGSILKNLRVDITEGKSLSLEAASDKRGGKLTLIIRSTKPM